MFIEDFKTSLVGNKLMINYFEGAVVVDVENSTEANKYLMGQVAILDRLKSNMLKEADKYINE